MAKTNNDSNTLIYTVDIENYVLDLDDEINVNIINNIKENKEDYSILKSVRAEIEDDSINVYSGKTKNDILIYTIKKEKKDDTLSIYVYEIKPELPAKLKLDDEKVYYKTLFSVVWKAIDNVKEEIVAELKHRELKRKDEIPDDSFKSDIKLVKIYEYLINEAGKKNSSNFNKLSLTIDDLFAEQYKGIDDLVKIVYKLYEDYYKDDNKTLYYAFIYTFEDFKRRDTVLDDLFYSGNLENHIKKTDSYLETEKYLKDVITRIYKDFQAGLYDKYKDIKGKKEFIVFVTDIVHEYHKLFCNMYEIPIKKECRDIDTVINYILKDHTNVTLEDYKKIKKWADTMLVDDGSMTFQQELLSNLSAMYLKNNKKDVWTIDKTELALVARYDEIMVKNKYDEKIFPIYSIFNFAKGCNDITEYEENTKKELEKINSLDVTDTMKDIIKSVTVIYHYIFLYQYGLDVGIKEEKKSIVETITEEIKNTNSIIEDIGDYELENYKPKAKNTDFDIDLDLDIDLDNPLDFDFDDDEDDDEIISQNIESKKDIDIDIEAPKEKTNIELDIENPLDMDLDLDLDLDLDDEEEESLLEKVEDKVEEIKDKVEEIVDTKEEIVEEPVIIEKKVIINTDNNLEYEVEEEKDKYIMNIILPGLKKSEIEVDYEYNKIIITTSDSETKSKITEKYYNNTLEYNIENVDEDGIDASLKSGILTIIIPKKTVSKKKITIK